MPSTSYYIDRSLVLRRLDYRVDAVRFRMFETTSSMLKKLKPSMDAIEKVLQDEKDVLKPSTILLAEDLEQKKAIKAFAGNLSRGHENLVREATDKTSPEVVAKVADEAATFVLADKGIVHLEVKSVDGKDSFGVILDISGKIYSGGFGTIFRVKRKDDPLALYALKVSAHGAEGLQDLEREKLIWQDLRHENILPLLGSTGMMDGKGLGLLSPYMEGRDLARYRLQCDDNYSGAELIPITCDAIQYLHRQGIIHGDIKPDNILLSPDNKALLCDFGLAKSPYFVDTAPNHVGAGSGSFVAPELRKAYDNEIHRAKTKESDIFALGKTMAQVISGEPSDNPLPPMPETLLSEKEKAVWALAERCCLPETSRPDIHHVADVLREIEAGASDQRGITS
ncbi:hypothetical protein M407DRAFT_33740 [Tulasnella calospora MUT 4182]|uniref:Protein kinase domain-containing protein n=1 Tax=Tulasnella calospora MUT 4182 TaxID=1051891 RepID=A0A0C3K5E7_9AGAM|nr:hypothetical protein M407DRAFT_33740 [Tulasnella calospora MUT 4182]